MAHARRRFFELHQQKTSNIAHEALEYIGQLYSIEREIDELFEKVAENQAKSQKQPRDVEKIRQIRQEKAKPIADKLYDWLQEKSNR